MSFRTGSMRFVASGLVALVLLLGPISPVFGATVSDWSFEEGKGLVANDTISSNDATLAGGTKWTSEGQSGSAVLFDGRDDRLEVPAATNLNNLTPLALDVWIYPTSLGEQGQGWVVSKAKGGGTLPTQGWVLRVNNSPRNSLVFAADFATSHLEVASVRDSISLNKWNHVQVNWDGKATATGVEILVDGKEVAYSNQENGQGARSDDASAPLRIGSNARLSRSFSGRIDETSIGGTIIEDTSTSTPAPTPVSGCTDAKATNYKATATVDDGSCQYPVVTSAFAAGSKVTPTATVNVRATPSISGGLVGTQAVGAIGTVKTDSPVSADGYKWIPVDFTSGADGWVAEQYLKAYVAPTTTPAPTPTPTPTPTTGTIWQPDTTTSWQWQLTGTIDTTVNAEMFDIDLFDAPQQKIDELKNKGRIVICYFSAGSYEDWRPDAKDFPTAVLGSSNGWPGEKWLDIRRIDLLGPVMEARLDLAVKKGCHGVEPDNIDGYTNKTGFPLTGADQIAFNKWLAAEAHERGLSIGLKNDLDQVKALEPYFNWALNEQCHQYSECDLLLPFIQKGKPVFITEYEIATTKFCSSANSNGFMAMKKKLDLDASREVCWTDGMVQGVTDDRAQTVTVLAPVRVRSVASTEASILAVVYTGDRGTVLGEPVSRLGEDWYQVQYDRGVTGWTYGGALKVE